MKKLTKQKTFVLFMVMAALLLLPMTIFAQQRDDYEGLFGSNNRNLAKRPENKGLMWAYGTRDASSTGNFGSQNFGASDGSLTNQTYGENVPLGSGIVILLLAGAGYVALKKKED